jgi:hypothetical protein
MTFEVCYEKVSLKISKTEQRFLKNFSDLSLKKFFFFFFPKTQFLIININELFLFIFQN